MTIVQATQYIARVILKRARIGMQLIRNDAVQNVTGRVLHRQTGHLAQNISAEAHIDGNRVEGNVGSDVFYGAIWEKTGHRAFTITAKPGHALAIPVFSLIGGARGSKSLASQFGGVFGLTRKPGSGPAKRRNVSTGYIFRQKVHIPAAAPKPWLHPAADARLPEIREALASDLAAAAEVIFARDIIVEGGGSSVRIT